MFIKLYTVMYFGNALLEVIHPDVLWQKNNYVDYHPRCLKVKIKPGGDIATVSPGGTCLLVPGKITPLDLLKVVS